MHTLEIINHDVINDDQLMIHATGQNNFTNELRLKAAIALINSLSDLDYTTQEEYDSYIKLCSTLKKSVQYL
ncbi:hypothetical protein [Companilactobacillus jidongensis]|uniref:hypothetical protein n=1 Tax=Companilactobacillus jidongensis TaxID=2486006 RepID=UPI000F77BFE2|nr:hypothetical protein [Companilactobacillus jidongensis]